MHRVGAKMSLVQGKFHKRVKTGLHIALLLLAAALLTGCFGALKPDRVPLPPSVIPVEPDPEAVAEVMAGLRTEANVGWWGFDPEDATDYIEQALKSPAKTIIIPNMGQDWIITPIDLRSDLNLVLEEGVVITAKKGGFMGTNDSLLNARNVENLTIVGEGSGAVLRMHKEDYTKEPYPSGEWRMGINIRGSKNVLIQGLTIRDSGGDGIYIGTGSAPYSENIEVRDVVLENNYRQGMSVISVKGLWIENVVFRNTAGTNPQAGIDFEPNGPNEFLEGITIVNSVFDNNVGPGIAIYPGRLKSDSTIDFTLENILVRGNSTGIDISVGTPDDHAKGQITIRECLVEKTQGSGIRIRNKDGNGLSVTVKDCVIHDVAPGPYSNTYRDWTPIFVDGGTRVGAITLSNITITDQKDRPALYGTVRSPQSGNAFFNIEGDLHVVNPYGALVVWNGFTDDANVTASALNSVVIDYGRFVTHPDYQDPSFEVVPGPIVDIPHQCEYVGSNVLDNHGFELLSGQAPSRWSATIPDLGSGWTTGVVTATGQAARTGDVGVELSGRTSYITQVADIVGGTTYELSAWLRSDLPASRSVGLKFEFINKESKTFYEVGDRYDATFDWNRIKLVAEAPPEAVRVRVFLRLHGSSTLYFDDASLHVIQCDGDGA